MIMLLDIGAPIGALHFNQRILLDFGAPIGVPKNNRVMILNFMSTRPPARPFGGLLPNSRLWLEKKAAKIEPKRFRKLKKAVRSAEKKSDHTLFT